MIWKCGQCDCKDEPCVIIDCLGTASKPQICPFIDTIPKFVAITTNELNTIITNTFKD